jgi:hypothetical protein
MTQDQGNVLNTKEAAFLQALDGLIETHGISIFFTAFAFPHGYWMRHGLSRGKPALGELKLVLEEELRTIEEEQKKDQIN